MRRETVVPEFVCQKNSYTGGIVLPLKIAGVVVMHLNDYRYGVIVF